MKEEILKLIEKYEHKVDCLNNLLDHPNKDNETIERLNVRKYERNTFIEDLKNITNKK